MNYKEHRFQSMRDKGDGDEILANFIARIVKEVRYVDGVNTQTVFTIEGETAGPDYDETNEPVKLPPVEVNAENFGAMSWAMSAWGSQCVIMPGTSIKDDLRTMIQLLSRPVRKTVYRRTGWEVIDGKRVYLHVGGAMGAKGNDPSVTVSLPPELARYDLRSSATPKDAVAASLDLVRIGPPSLTWPLLAATFAPVYCACDWTMHVTGRTGSFKSELSSLFQSHYGAGMDARHLPANWQSTPNALEALAFYACNAVMVVDDFIPSGTSYAQKQYQGNADKVIRSQGNQAGRARLTDVSSLQTTMYPRGLILSTGEDTPEGHSVRGRMLIREITPGDINAADLTRAQKNRPLYPGTIAYLVQTLAAKPADLTERVEFLRDEFHGIAHGRTPTMMAKLIAVIRDALDRFEAGGLIGKGEAGRLGLEAQNAIIEAGEQQASYIEDSDPVDQFLAVLRQVLASGGGHFRTLKGGTPQMPELLGWTAEREIGGIQTYKARGPVLGWVRVNNNELYLDATVGYNVVRKAAGQELTLSKQTLLKRVKEAGHTARVDESRGRNTVRVIAENHPRQVLALILSQALDTTEVGGAKASPQNDAEEEADAGDGEE